MIVPAAPFEVVHADPWASELLDLPSLNAAAGTAVEEAVAAVRQRARAGSESVPTPSLVLVGPAGSGKTHLFARLRRRLGARAVFVYLRPILGTDLTPRIVLHEIVAALAKSSLGPPEAQVRQLDVLAGAALAVARGANTDFPQLLLADLQGLSDFERQSALSEALEMFLERCPGADEAYARQVFSAPFVDRPTQRALLAWLSGREPEVV